jgi:micrococcal nuclease
MTRSSETKRPESRSESSQTRLRKLIFLAGAIALLVANFAVPHLPFAKPIPAQANLWIVKRAVSGKTIEVFAANDITEKIQRVVLSGVSAPLTEQQPWSGQARQYLDDLLRDQKVLLEFEENRTDISNRPIAYVWLGDRLINQVIVAKGYVLSDISVANNKYQAVLESAQVQARLLELGIWDLDKPMRQTPRDLRR